MSNGERPPIQTVRLSKSDQHKVIEEINRRPLATSATANRRGPRVNFESTVIVVLVNAQGSKVKYSVPPRNLSGRGLGFIHGQFVHANTTCEVVLPTRSGQWVRIEGKVIACRHATGLIHAVSVRFNEVIDLRNFVELTPAEECANQQELANASIHDAAPAIPERAIEALHGNVLVIDDFESDSQLLKFWLEKQGAQVQAATDAAAALELTAANTAVNLIVLDMNLGKKNDGLQLAGELRKRGFKGPIIAASSDDGEESEAAAMAAGCNAYLVKPIERQAFLRSVDQLLSFDSDAAKAGGIEPIRSTLTADPEMKPLVERFVAELGRITERLKLAGKSKDTDAIHKICHQLKGTGASFGFAPISQMARLALGQLQAATNPEHLQKAIDDLIATAARAAAD